MIYLILFYEFFKIGLLAVGGGLASLPFLQDMVARYGWITSDELLNMIAISESTPGPIGTNVATYVGFTIGGVPGALVATLSEVAPSIIIITLIARSLKSWGDNPLVKGAFSALRPAVAGLIGAVALTLARSELLHVESWQLGGLFSALDWPAIVMFGVLVALIMRFKWHPVLVMAGAAVIGIVFQM